MLKSPVKTLRDVLVFLCHNRENKHKRQENNMNNTIKVTRFYSFLYPWFNLEDVVNQTLRTEVCILNTEINNRGLSGAQDVLITVAGTVDQIAALEKLVDYLDAESIKSCTIPCPKRSDFLN